MARCHRCYIAMKRAEEDEDSDAAAYQDGYRDGARTRRAGLEPGLIKAAVVLCHPDRHPPERFAQANSVTARLLELLGATRTMRR